MVKQGILWPQVACKFPDNKVHGACMGPPGPRWAPCWPHEPCYHGTFRCLNHHSSSMRHTLLQSRSGYGPSVLTSTPRPQALHGWAYQLRSFLPNLVIYEDMSHALSPSATRCHTLCPVRLGAAADVVDWTIPAQALTRLVTINGFDVLTLAKRSVELNWCLGQSRPTLQRLLKEFHALT